MLSRVGIAAGVTLAILPAACQNEAPPAKAQQAAVDQLDGYIDLFETDQLARLESAVIEAAGCIAPNGSYTSTDGDNLETVSLSTNYNDELGQEVEQLMIAAQDVTTINIDLFVPPNTVDYSVGVTANQAVSVITISCSTRGELSQLNPVQAERL